MFVKALWAFFSNAPDVIKYKKKIYKKCHGVLPVA